MSIGPLLSWPQRNTAKTTPFDKFCECVLVFIYFVIILQYMPHLLWDMKQHFTVSICNICKGERKLNFVSQKILGTQHRACICVKIKIMHSQDGMFQCFCQCLNTPETQFLICQQTLRCIKPYRFHVIKSFVCHVSQFQGTEKIQGSHVWWVGEALCFVEYCFRLNILHRLG
jgi:hypothetical protein